MKTKKKKSPEAIATPLKKTNKPLFGKMQKTVHIKGDIVKPIDVEWDAES